ncbi:MAG: DUF1697 domain-containing protein [Fodinibius sp.]|nr:DUF1697 domain-containing protein [Fodinibius sp.]
MTYIALLRGINVGGHRRLTMDELRQMFSEMGFANVTTYIQNGNVVFTADDEADAAFLSTQISVKIAETFGYEVPVVIRSRDRLANVLADFPFKEKEGWKGYISFLANKPMNEQAAELEAAASQVERFSVQGSELFSIVNKQAEATPQFSNSFVEQRLGVPATTRNLQTVRKIIDIASPS